MKAPTVLMMNDSMYETMYALERTHWWFRGKRKIVLSAIPSRVQNTELIDFGCGTGIMLKELCKLGEVTGLDKNANALDFCRNRVDVRLVQADLSERLPLDTKYDVGVALDVLEHIEDDLSALINMRDTLQYGSTLIITVPAFKFMWSTHDEQCAHKRRYSYKELEKLIISSGLIIDYLSYYNSFLFPVIALLRCFNKVFNNSTKNELENKQYGKAVNSILYYIFICEKFFIQHRIKLPFGVSLIAVLRRGELA